MARDINVSGNVIGQLTIGSGSTVTSSSAFFWENGVATDLGTLGGTVGNALDINEQNQIVGTSTTASGVPHAFVSDGGSLLDLNNLLFNPSGWELQQATSINDLGQIVGYGLYTDNNGVQQTRAFILEPQSTPESSNVFGLLAVGAIGLASVFKMRRN